MRLLPNQEPRVETGPVTFGDDWPGVFIRGDNAMYYASVLKQELHIKHPIYKAVIYGLISDLESCDQRKVSITSPSETTFRKTI